MHGTRVYGSKEEIYADGYAIAVKFAIDRSEKSYLNSEDYSKIMDHLTKKDQIKLDEFSSQVKNFQRQYPISTGFFVEIPVRGDTGQQLGTRFILLKHETGLEIFIFHHLTWATAGVIGIKTGEMAAGVIAKTAIGVALSRVVSFLGLHWRQLSGVKIDHVEVRSERKGSIRLPFSDFRVDQLMCLMEHFDHVSEIIECNQTCFSGLAVPHSPSDFTGPQDTQAGSPAPAQARD